MEPKWLEAARKITAEHQHQYVHQETGVICKKNTKGAVLLDGFTASMLVQVYDALNEENKEKFGNVSLLRAVEIGWKVTKKVQS